MVTEAGKELLRNSIYNANFHNKILEQNEMWKQWEIERGLTMMVSDDDVLKRIRKNHRCSKHRKMAEEKEWSRSNINTDAVAGTSSSDRWDHSGFQELYPDESDRKRPSVSSSVKQHSKKWGHSGFHELYPDEGSRERSSSTSSSPRSALKKCDQDSSSNEGKKRLFVSSSGKKCKKKCRRCGEGFNNAVKERSNFDKTVKKCRRCRERIPSAVKEKSSILSGSKNCEEKSNDHRYRERHCNEPGRVSNSYEELYRSECYRRPSRASKKNYRRRRLSPPPNERIMKWDHDKFLELYPELHKKKKPSRSRKFEAQREKEKEKEASI